LTQFHVPHPHSEALLATVFDRFPQPQADGLALDVPASKSRAISRIAEIESVTSLIECHWIESHWIS
jgi:hypothetical protein